MITLVAAVSDLRKGDVGNWISLSGIVIGILLHGISGYSEGGWVSAGMGSLTGVLGAVLCGAMPLVWWRLGVLGGGDAKLLAAVGALCGAAIGLEVQFFAFSLALLYAGAKLSFKGQLLRLLWNGFVVVAKVFKRSQLSRREIDEVSLTMRFAPAVCAGMVMATLARAASL